MIKPAFYITILLMMLSLSVAAQQNLVVNGDFEEYSSCPLSESTPFQNPKEIEKCIGWKAPTYGTSDYFNICASNPTISIPTNFGGEQAPFSGDGYLGAYLTSYTGGTGDDGYSGIMWWEYIQGHLIHPLEQGKLYKFSMEISLGEYSDLMINEIGVYFSNTSISSPNTAALTVNPQCVFFEPNYFSDTLNWIHLETYFISLGGEQFLTIGNFKDNVNTDTLRRYNHEPLIINPYITYFYFDNLILTPVSSNIQTGNIFSPNGDNVNDFWQLSFSENPGNKTVSILNRWGNLITESDLNGFSWDGKTNDGKECSEGIYFYRVSDTDIAGFIQLIR